MQVEIRRAEPDDAAALSLVSQATFLDTYAHMIPRADMLVFAHEQHGVQRYAAWLRSPEHMIWIAEARATCAPVGYALVTTPDLPVPTGKGDLELKRIYTLRRMQGSGLGARLMEAAILSATSAGATRLLLGVHSGNARAIAFYARQGFTQAGVRTFRVGQSVFDDLVLARPLAGSAT